MHLTPVRANLLEAAERLLAYPCSSFGYYLCAPEHRPGWMRVDQLERRGWTEGSLAGRRKNDPGKMAVAVRLRRKTTLTVKQIAARVHLGTSYTANKRLHEAIKALPTVDPSQTRFGI